MLSSNFINDHGAFLFTDMATYIGKYLKEYYNYLDITDIIYSVLILDYNSNKKLDIKFSCIYSAYNEPLLIFCWQDNIRECGHSSPKSIMDNFDIESYIDSCLKSLGYEKLFNLFNLIDLPNIKDGD